MIPASFSSAYSRKNGAAPRDPRRLPLELGSSVLAIRDVAVAGDRRDPVGEVC